MSGMFVVPRPEGDEAARERIRTSLGESLIVEASAGTGKTTELVGRLVRVLETGAGQIQNVVAVTFTHKAAGELKLRLRQRLDEARREATGEGSARNLEEALKRLEEAFIGTIHAFCAQLLRERPVEAVVDPAFEEMAEGAMGRLFEGAFRAWFQEKLNEPSPAVRRALARLAWRESFQDSPPLDQLKSAGRSLIEWRDFPAAWARPGWEREREIDQFAAKVVGLAEMSGKPRWAGDSLYKSLGAAREFAARLGRMEGSGRDYDAIEGLLVRLKRDLGPSQIRKGSGPYGDGVVREDVYGAWQGVLRALVEFDDRASADLAAGLREEMRGLVREYEERKRKSGKLDFTDLLLLARDLLRGNVEVRRYLQGRFSHIFVDEFQDTDPLQAEILLLLAADDAEETSWLRSTPVAGKLFLVGDPKQSVYKFRRADLGLYARICAELTGRGVGLARLTRSFRSVRPIQEFVNRAFSEGMTGDQAAAEALYSPLEEGAEAIAGQPALVALPAPRPFGKSGKVTKWAINECLPDAVMAFVEWLLTESGWRVREGGALVAVRSSHVAVLFRRLTDDVTKLYVRSCEAREIPHLLVGAKGFHNREEVETIRAALAAIEWPGDELSVFAALKGGLFGIPDDSLLRFREEFGRLHPMAASGQNEQVEKTNSPSRFGFVSIFGVLGFLAELHRERNRRPIADTLNALLEFTRAHAGFALRPAGRQALANVYRMITMARAFELGGGLSFRAFVEELDARGESESKEAPVLEEGAEGIRMMTVHAAKGLEFPVVILADLTAKLNRMDPERYIDADRGLCATRLLGCAPEDLRVHCQEELARERAEGVRVAYVAATRARDLLVVPAVGDGPFEDGWLSPLNGALYPPRGAWRSPQSAEGCPVFGDSTVLEGEGSIKPGLHGEVVWWDPGKLRLRVPRAAGLLREDLLKADGGAGLVRYQGWLAKRTQAVAAGSQASREVFTATAAVGEVPGDVRVSLEEVAGRTTGGARGRRFGTLVHGVLRDVALDAGRGTVEAMARAQGRLLGSGEAEVSAAVESAMGALGHSLVVRARRAERCLRECPVTLVVEGGRVLEGTIDLAFLEGGVWTIVDFKTDVAGAGKRAGYERQLRWYALALGRITGAAVRAVLLGI